MKRISVISILFLVLVSGTTNAQDADNRQIPDSVRMLAIDEVTVLGRQNRTIVPAQILSGEKLQRLNSHSVSDALRYFSGVQIKDYGGIGGLKTVNISSMGRQHVRVFYDLSLIHIRRCRRSYK